MLEIGLKNSAECPVSKAADEVLGEEKSIFSPRTGKVAEPITWADSTQSTPARISRFQTVISPAPVNTQIYCSPIFTTISSPRHILGVYIGSDAASGEPPDGEKTLETMDCPRLKMKGADLASSEGYIFRLETAGERRITSSSLIAFYFIHKSLTNHPHIVHHYPHHIKTLSGSCQAPVDKNANQKYTHI